MEDLFLKALPLLRELKKHGRQAYFVGGSVRDAQMNRDIGDIDIATDASPEEIEAIFRKPLMSERNTEPSSSSLRENPMR